MLRYIRDSGPHLTIISVQILFDLAGEGNNYICIYEHKSIFIDVLRLGGGLGAPSNKEFFFQLPIVFISSQLNLFLS